MLDLPLRQTLLARSDLFRGMPEHLLRYVATHRVERTLDDRELLYLKDDTLAFIALLVEGRMAASRLSAVPELLPCVRLIRKMSPMRHNRSFFRTDYCPAPPLILGFV